MPECNGSVPVFVDIPIPNWLTKEYIEKSLRSHNNDESVKIVEYKVIPATSKGESYASVMFRFILKFVTDSCPEPETGNYIVKLSFEDDEFVNDKLSVYDIYKREIEIYEIIIPKMSALLEKGHINEYIFPATISVDYDRDAILFEDLTAKSFVMAPRIKGLDMAHVKLILRKLAKMHAASAVLNENEPGIFKSYDRGFFNRYTNSFRTYYENCLETCGKVVSQWEDFRYYGEKLLKLKSVVMEYGRRSFEANKNHFNVLNHGDLWVNNVMFQYNEKNEPIEAVLIDFQYACWTSPALDLHYFFNTSLRNELRFNNQDELVQYYFYNLVDSLKAMGYKGKIPTLLQFWTQFIDKSFYALVSSCIVQPVMLNENTENADFAAIVGEDQRATDFKWMLYSNEKVHKNLRKLLPIFDRRGLLDVN